MPGENSLRTPEGGAAVGALPLPHQEAAEEAQREETDSQAYPTAGEFVHKDPALAGGEHHHHIVKCIIILKHKFLIFHHYFSISSSNINLLVVVYSPADILVRDQQVSWYLFLC